MKYQYKEMPESMKGTYGEFSKTSGLIGKNLLWEYQPRCFLSQHINLTGSQMLRCSHGQDLRVRTMEADIT